MGVPARQHGWISRYGERLALRADGSARCPHTGDRYAVAGGRCTLLSHEPHPESDAWNSST